MMGPKICIKCGFPMAQDDDGPDMSGVLGVVIDNPSLCKNCIGGSKTAMKARLDLADVEAKE